MATLSLSSTAPMPPPATPPKDGAAAAAVNETTSRLLGAGARTAATMHGAGGEEDDGQGWIGIDNLQEARARGSEAMFMGARAGGIVGTSSSGGKGGGQQVAAATIVAPPGVACVTADFGMQNVLLQMGLHLLSVDGVAVTRVKQWVRRCDACAKLVHDPERMFCPRCGNAYLSRASVSVDRETGQLKVHLSKLWRPRKGCKYAIPKPDKHGRFEGDLLLREDQLMMGIWRQRVKRRTKAVDSMFGSDVTEALGLGPVGRTAAQEGIQFGYGRKNPNCQKGRERRGKKKRSKAK
jgi:RNA-binding protein NOB1